MGERSKFLKHVQDINVEYQAWCHHPRDCFLNSLICTGVRKPFLPLEGKKSAEEDAKIVIFSLTVSSVNHDAMLQQAIFSVRVEISTFSQWE